MKIIRKMHENQKFDVQKVHKPLIFTLVLKYMI